MAGRIEQSVAEPLTAEFFDRDTCAVARELVGYVLLSRLGNKLTGGVIVETEAYLPRNDLACHAARGKTRKNAAMFGIPGSAYVYPIHAKYCFNVVTESQGTPAAVLIRALLPLWGLEVMHRRRETEKVRELTSGPAKLCQALQIDRQMDGWDLTLGKRLWIARQASNSQDPIPLLVTPRIGITADQPLPLRYVWQGSPWASGPKAWR